MKFIPPGGVARRANHYDGERDRPHVVQSLPIGCWVNIAAAAIRRKQPNLPPFPLFPPSLSNFQKTRKKKKSEFPVGDHAQITDKGCC